LSENNQLQNILIVGGGTAGWMTASWLCRFLGNTETRITLIESPRIGTIGVGEATVPPLVAFLRLMGIDEDEFMRETHATYKLGIKFIDWIEKGDSYWHPFGPCGGTIDGIDLFHHWLKSTQAGTAEGPYSSYSVQAQLAEADKGPRPVIGNSPIIDTGGYAYHLDANAFADYLKEDTVQRGVSHIQENIQHVATDNTGTNITQLVTESGQNLDADLYIDCSGFRGLLIEQGLGDPWIDWSDMLLCDRAVSIPQEKDEVMHPYTRSTAMDAGWMWQIPLTHRTGCGYVYSSAHTDDDAAADELMSKQNAGAQPLADPLFIKMRVGRRQNFWAGNCISVGLSSGFIEPLESTGIFFIQKAVELILQYFPDRNMSPALATAYNQRMARTYEEVRDFIILHYLTNQRGEDSFWRDSREVNVPDSLASLIDLYREAGIVETRQDMLFPEPSIHHIMSGGRIIPHRHSALADQVKPEVVRDILGKIKAQNEYLMKHMPLHSVLLNTIHK
jgi:tryptophan halogenase